MVNFLSLLTRNDKEYELKMQHKSVLYINLGGQDPPAHMPASPARPGSPQDTVFF